MKKLKVVLTSVLLGVLVFVLASCGGASGAISSVVSNVKKLDYEKASEYCLDADLVKAMQAEEESEYKGLDEDVVKDMKAMQKKIYGEFKYTVSETVLASDEKTATVTIKYTTVNFTALSGKMADWIAKNTSISDGMDALTDLNAAARLSLNAFDACWKDREKTEEKTATVTLTNQDGEWKVDSGVALIAIMAL